MLGLEDLIKMNLHHSLAAQAPSPQLLGLFGECPYGVLWSFLTFRLVDMHWDFHGGESPERNLFI